MPIIRQSDRLAVIPSFRNWRNLLKIIAAAHVLIFAFAIANSNGSYHFINLMREYITWAEPGLLITLLILFFCNNWIHRRPFPKMVVMLITLFVFSLDLLLLSSIHNADKLLVICVFMLVVMYYSAWKMRVRSSAIAEARLVALTSRIRPHFLFNSLNAAISLVREQPDKAEMILENLADLFRAQLAEPGRTSTLEKEVELAKMYLSIEQERLGSRLCVKWTIHAPGDTILPPLLLQPLLENAVYHGVERRRHPSEINVSVELIKRRISIAVLNPIDPEKPSLHDGNKIALKNLAERLALIFDDEATLYADNIGDTFLVRLELPYHSAQGEE